MAGVGAAAEVGGALVAAGEATALTSYLGPAAAGVGAVVGLGVLIGVAFKNIFHDDSPEVKKQKQEANRRLLMNKYNSISKKYIDAQENVNVNDNTLRPEDVLNKDEIEFMNKMQPKYFDTVDTSLKDIKDYHKQQFDEMKKVADTYDETRRKAEKESFYSTDEMLFANAVDEWTPDQSAILEAHQQGMTLDRYNRYITNVVNDTNEMKHIDINDTQNLFANDKDIEHFKSDLVYAGYQPDAYKYVKDAGEGGVYKFVKNDELVRNPEQIAEIAALRDTKGDPFVRDLIQKSGNFQDNLKAVTQNLLFTYEPVTFDANESKYPFSWTMYEQYQTDIETEWVPTNENKLVHSLIHLEKDKLSARKFAATAKADGLTVSEYREVKDDLQKEKKINATDEEFDAEVSKIKNEDIKI